jgi:hypothetical protein
MREIRTSGSEGGAGRKPRSYLYLGAEHFQLHLLGCAEMCSECLSQILI